jgi:hypothetical protein
MIITHDESIYFCRDIYPFGSLFDGARSSRREGKSFDCIMHPCLDIPEILSPITVGAA